MLRVAATVACIASAAAFSTPALSGLRMSLERRDVIKAGSAAAAAAPFLGAKAAGAASKTMPADGYAPVITVFDHRGCTRAPKEYNGPKANDMEDNMLVKVESIKCKVTESFAASLLQEQLGYINDKA